MPISFVPEREKKEKREKRGLKIPLLFWWILIPLLILGAISYFVFQEIPESEIVLRTQDIGLLKDQDFVKIERNLELFDKKNWKELFKELQENIFTRIPKVPSKEVGRSTPLEEPK